MVQKDFVEVTAISDGMRAAIRSECIKAVLEDSATDEEGNSVEYRTIDYDGGSIDVNESYEEIMAMIYRAEF